MKYLYIIFTILLISSCSYDFNNELETKVDKLEAKIDEMEKEKEGQKDKIIINNSLDGDKIRSSDLARLASAIEIFKMNGNSNISDIVITKNTFLGFSNSVKIKVHQGIINFSELGIGEIKDPNGNDYIISYAENGKSNYYQVGAILDNNELKIKGNYIKFKSGDLEKLINIKYIPLLIKKAISKISSDLSTLSSAIEVGLTDGKISKINDIVIEKNTHKVIINGEEVISHQGIINFATLRQDGTNFKNTNGDEYIISIAIQGKGRYYQIMGILEETNKAVIKGNYVKRKEGDSIGLIKINNKIMINGN